MRLLTLAFYSLLFSGCLQENFLSHSSSSPISKTESALLPLPCELTITSSGHYTLTKDITTETCAIEVKASNVKIDLNRHTLQGPNNKNSVSYGVKSVDQSSVEVFNGNIDGFLYGVAIVSSGGRGDSTKNNYVHDLEVTNSSQKGIRVGGYNVKVINNTVRNTGKTELKKNLYGFGIEVKGPDCIVSNNKVFDTYGGGISSEGFINEGVAISFSNYSTYCVAENNYIENSEIVLNKSTFGFWVDVYSVVSLKNNYVRNMHYSGVVPEFTILENNNLDKPFIHVITDRN